MPTVTPIFRIMEAVFNVRSQMRSTYQNYEAYLKNNHVNVDNAFQDIILEQMKDLIAAKLVRKFMSCN